VTNLNGAVDPYEAFNIAQCDTYQDLWAWDVMMTCGEGNGSEECACTFAEELMEMERFSCEDECPQGCTICNNCLRILGCLNVPAGAIAAGVGDGRTIPAAALFTVLFGISFCVACKRNRGKSDANRLGDRLMDTESERSDEGKVWMVPVDSELSVEHGGSRQPVWLIPAGGAAAASSTNSSSILKNSQIKKGTSALASTQTTRELVICLILLGKELALKWKLRDVGCGHRTLISL
jgi:hypothetical protein